MWDNPRLGIESMSPALAGEFLTPGPRGKSVCSFFNQMELETKWLTADLRGSAGKGKCLMRFPSTWDESEGLWRASNRGTEQEHQLLAVALGACPTPVAPDFPQGTKRSVDSRAVQSFSRVWLCGPMDCSTPAFPVFRSLPEFAQTHVCWVGDAIQPSYPLSPPSPPAPNMNLINE